MHVEEGILELLDSREEGVTIVTENINGLELPCIPSSLIVPWPSGKRLSYDIVEWLVECKLAGYTVKEIATLTGISKSAIYHALEEVN